MSSWAPRLPDTTSLNRRHIEPRRGCFVFCTAPAEAASDPDVAATMSRTISEVDAALRARFQRAREEGEIGDDKDPLVMAQLAQSVLHGLALRARSGASRASLRRFIAGAVNTLAGPSA